MHRIIQLLVWTLVPTLLPVVALAAEGADAQAVGTGLPYLGYGIGAGLAAGLAGLGCGIGQGLTAGNTTAGIARNPGASGVMNTPFILGMVLIESIAIYGLLIGILLWLKLPG
ncbi:ATP synthase F0 subunit C [Myxococcota bacterium]|nr:ATP synthase F0 subunit C [Myxococcota bacterium]